LTALSQLMNAQQLIGELWTRDPSPDEVKILELASNVPGFIFATGQRYAFEDFSERAPDVTGQPREVLADSSAFLRGTESFLMKRLGETASAEEHAQLQALLIALRFIASTGQHDALKAYLEHVALNAPPFVVAAFDTWVQAEAWLESHPSPPDPASVLIAGSCHDVVYDRKTNIRRMPRNRDLHEYLAELTRAEPPVAAASFATREEAERWLSEQVEPARRQWVSIAGELYLAAYYPHIRYQALYPLAMAKSPERR